MDEKVNTAKTEKILLLTTTVFLCVLLGLFVRDLYVPPLPESADVETTGAEEEAERVIVNINTATEKELDILPGIGPSLAKRIVEYRKSNGPFHGKEELMDVSGIGEVTFAKVSDYICVK